MANSNQEAYIEELKQAISDGEINQTDNLAETIYQIDDIKISGDFDYGIRGVDHNVLTFDKYEWQDILEWGTVIVPETSSYISDTPVQELEDIGFNSLPVNDNHIIKEAPTTTNENNPDSLYHGSKVSFDEFEIPEYHTNGGDLGFGTYLTNDLDRAKMYADNDGYLYTVELNDELKNSTPLSPDKVTLTKEQVTQIIEEVSKQEMQQDGYPYMLSDWGEPTSETTMDAGNKKIAQNMAESVIDDTDDLNIINGINNELGGNASGAKVVVPALNKMGIHYAELKNDYDDVSKEYVIFNPKDIKIVNRSLANPEQQTKQAISNDNKIKEPTLSEQYKGATKQAQNQHTDPERMNKIITNLRQKISEQTQSQLKDFAKENPALKQPKKHKREQTMQR